MTPDELARLELSWPGCTFWSLEACPDALVHESIVAALELDSLRDAGHAIDWFLRWKPSGTLTVYGWTRKRVTDADVASMLDELTEAFHEHWCHGLELGNADPAPGDDEPEPIEWLRAALIADMHHRPVWQCEQTHTVSLDPDAVISLIRSRLPELVAAYDAPKQGGAS